MSYQPPYIQGPLPQQPPPPKKSKTNLVIAIVIGVAIVLVGLIASCSALLINLPTAEQTSSAPVSSPQTPAPSPSFASPQQPEEPTPTPPKPTVSKADADYRRWVTDFLPHTTELQSLIADFQEDAKDSDIEAVEKDARKLIRIADKMRDNQPPKSGKYKRLHKEYNSMVDDFKSAGVLIRDGAKGGGDYYLISEGAAKLEAAGKHAEKVGDEIERVS